ncbi:hypothetical protein QH494_09010 [Sphingomonas sp. AR_OL41]|uniref:hypothetical protein n=1 Tax=Sphingomonas sp. AR_OL41 TaxID=3042729 RepID=UPI00247FE3DA|nr:hypothetical protein [Sphingomonas sp. AR_OL41]MDH7972319.1 hypothetical protein [Sphingomonas sp. AR_OL41]
MSIFKMRLAGSSGAALPALVLLSGCGGGSSTGGVASTPTPPASYTKIADMTGNRTFVTGGIQYNSVPNVGFSNAATQAYGAGVTVAYTAASDSYKLTAPDGSTVTFDPSNAQAPTPGSNAQTWVKISGTTRDQFLLAIPSVGGVPLSYTVIGTWSTIDTTTNRALVRLAVGGAPTIASDMPKTGTATYNTSVGGAAVVTGVPVSYTLTGNSTATFSANFGTGAITTSLTLGGTPSNGSSTVVTSFGTFNGTGSIAAGGPGFAGTLTGTGANGIFSGVFQGPQALEMGYDWSITGTNVTAVGSVVGVKQ